MSLEFRYRRLGYVALNVTDLARSWEFYQTLVGLDPAGEATHGERLLRCSDSHHDIVLREGTTPGLSRVGWEMESPRDLELIRDHCRELGLRMVEVSAEDCSALGISDAFRVAEPLTGATFEYFHSMADAPEPFSANATKIERLGHLVLGTPRFQEAEAHFRDHFNFRISDRIDPAVVFMRCFPNPLHHSLGIGASDSAKLHHVNFMVSDIDDIGQAFWRIKRNEVPIVFGPGRHTPSDSIFLYFLDPDGLTLEYSFGMEEFPEIGAREPRNLPPTQESIDYWGAEPAPEMAAIGGIEALRGG